MAEEEFEWVVYCGTDNVGPPRSEQQRRRRFLRQPLEEQVAAATHVLFPHDMKEFPMEGFANQSSLLAVNMKHAKEITQVPLLAFACCEQLQEIRLPDSLLVIGNHAFVHNCSLEGICLPTSVTKIGNGAFFGCRSLRRVGNVSTNHGATQTEQNNFMEQRQLKFKETMTTTVGCLPPNLQEIGNCAFSNCSRLEEMCLPESTHSIGHGAFQFCPCLRQVHLSTQLSSLGRYSFRCCEQLREINLSSLTSLHEIKEGTFHSCQSLVTVDLSQTSIQRIGSLAFQKCTSLRTIHLPMRIQHMGERVFEDCDSLETVYLPQCWRWCYFQAHLNIGSGVRGMDQAQGLDRLLAPFLALNQSIQQILQTHRGGTFGAGDLVNMLADVSSNATAVYMALSSNPSEIVIIQQ